jgi:hypothetical protein
MLRALEPLLLAHLTLTIVEDGFEIRKLCPSQSRGTQKNKSLNTTNVIPQTPKKNLHVVLLLLKFQDDL